MKSSLKNKLFEAIRCTYPFVYTINQVELLAKEEGRKVSYAERELRHLSENKVIEPVFNDTKRYIKGYKYVPTKSSVEKSINLAALF